MYGVDYAFLPHPAPGALVAARVTFVGRYVSPQAVNDSNGKNLLAGELAALRRAGLAIILYAEQYAQRMAEGRSAGVADARHFATVTQALGMTGAVMYCAADWDATAAQQAAINAYLDGAASVIGRARTGIYGGYYPVKRALDAGKARYAVQTIAWSGGLWDGRVHVRQGAWVTIGGVQCDRLDSMTADFGQWPRPVLPGSFAPMEDDVIIPAGAKGVGVSFNGCPYTTISFCADPSALGTADVVVRVAMHHRDGGAAWDVATVTITKAAPKQILRVPSGTDGVSFQRADTVPIDLVPSFA